MIDEPQSRINEPSVESLNVHLSELHGRIHLHAARLWQLPFAYLGLVVFFFASVHDMDPGLIQVTQTFLVVVGVVALTCLLGAFEGIVTGSRLLTEVESRLQLPRASGKRSRAVYHFLPYVVLHLCGILSVCLIDP